IPHLDDAGALQLLEGIGFGREIGRDALSTDIKTAIVREQAKFAEPWYRQCAGHYARAERKNSTRDALDIAAVIEVLSSDSGDYFGIDLEFAGLAEFRPDCIVVDDYSVVDRTDARSHNRLIIG